MIRFVLRRFAIIPLVLLLVNFFGFAYARLVGPQYFARNPLYAGHIDTTPIIPAYADYLRGLVHLDIGGSSSPDADPGETALATIGKAAVASLGLLSLSLALSVLVGLALGLRAARSDPPRVSPWLTALATLGLAMPGFYVGSLLIAAMFAYILWGPGGQPPFPLQGFGWDRHLVLPTLVLMMRPTAQIAQVVSGLLVNELGKPYIVAARSVGNTWQAVFRRHAFRNIIASVATAVSGALRLLVGELIVVELLFYWPGLGLMIAQTLIPPQLSTVGHPADFLNPRILATLLALFAALFLIADFVTGVVVRKYDPRLHTT